MSNNVRLLLVTFIWIQARIVIPNNQPVAAALLSMIANLTQIIHSDKVNLNFLISRSKLVCFLINVLGALLYLGSNQRRTELVDLNSGSVRTNSDNPTGFSYPSDVSSLTFRQHGCQATYNGEIFFFGGGFTRDANRRSEAQSVSNFLIIYYSSEKFEIT